MVGKRLTRSVVAEWVALCLVSGVLGSVALVAQVRALGISRFGYIDPPSAFEYIETGIQWTRHRAILDGDAPSPWQYRVFSAWINQAAIEVCTDLGMERPVAAGFLTVRLLQNIGILVLAGWFYRRSGLSPPVALLGVSILALAIAQAVYDSDLATNTYFDLAFYLLAALLVVEGRPIWVIPVVAVAALNRETSMLIPFVMLAGGLRWDPLPRASRRALGMSAIAAAVFLAGYFGVRAAFGPRPLFEPYGVAVGLDRLSANLFTWQPWFQLFLTFGIVPLLSIFGLRSAPTMHRNLWLLLVPCWAVVHLALAVIAETRLFLVPMALAFIPCTLFLVVSSDHMERASHGR